MTPYLFPQRHDLLSPHSHSPSTNWSQTGRGLVSAVPRQSLTNAVLHVSREAFDAAH